MLYPVELRAQIFLMSLRIEVPRENIAGCSKRHRLVALAGRFGTLKARPKKWPGKLMRHLPRFTGSS